MSETPRHPDEDDDATVHLPRSDRSTPPTGPAGPGGSAGVSGGPAGVSGGPAGVSGSGATADAVGPGRAVGEDPAVGSGRAVGGDPAVGSSLGGAPATSSGAGSGATGGARPKAGGLGAGWRRLVGSVGASERRRLRPAPATPAATDGAGTPEERQRRRRQWWVAGISAGSALVVIALCAGLLWVVDIVDDDEGDSAVRESEALRDQSCLDLERRLNRLTPPGATANPAARAVAIRDENAAVRLYVGEINDQRAQDGWRQLLDARGVFADALDRQAKSRTPAFYVVPRGDHREPVTAALLKWSPATCAGPLRRLAAPDL